MINSGDTAWILISTGLVCLMTPALAFFGVSALPHRRERLFVAFTGCETPFHAALQNPPRNLLQLNEIPECELLLLNPEGAAGATESGRTALAVA